MKTQGWIAGIGLGALCAAGIAVAPAIGAQQELVSHSAQPDSRFGSFTPASADPKLAASLARSGIDPSDFRFTPTESRADSDRSVTVAVRARTSRGSTEPVKRTAASSQDSLTLAPIAYNLGVSVGWKRFAVTGDVSKLDLPGQPGSHQSAEVGVSYRGDKFTGRVQAANEKPLPNQPQALTDNPSYSIDVGGSYSIARNLDLTAGVRYKSEQNRLPRLDEDNRRDSQAVYVGTAFRF
ncbi:porin [Stakelama sp. CBK3Z-3]|uniref:Porin n=1 Tax=Stakelama flava TaxID=2860338 RepID=A0ABS6XLA4_9SPHN|nr:porin [Stakelama flava]MBW4330709.1 porin [Stakelama flava]